VREKSFAAKGDAVIVTGAAGGIGAATVENLVNQGIFVFAVDRNAEALTKILASIDPKGALTQAIAIDVTSEKEC
jgi:NADP-dependent 3-hydroxy acid dehydrogenase YdfG